MSEATDMAAEAPSSAVRHPEEMAASVDLRIGDAVALRASARATPAGLIALALLAAGILLPLAMLARGRLGSSRHHPRR